MKSNRSLKDVVEMVQKLVARKMNGRPATVFDVQNILKADGHGRDAYRLAKYWLQHGTKVVGWTDFGDPLRVNVAFKMD